ncbi:MAG: CCA tRNA nucleotidyltransferase [Planctomycetes bacterium]|nr:CCA tRNA nucleotidyltransferase [Planctomycetota bacterium]
MDRPQRLELELPDLVRDAVEALRARGGRVWLVGGSVRDALLGLPVSDWDLTTDLAPAAAAAGLRAVLPERGRSEEDELGVVRFADRAGLELSVSTLRVERAYGPDRRPRRVTFVTEPARDAMRRDFTVNAIYAALPDGALLDPCGGLPDLVARRLRTVGEPAGRFREDPLRILRALRFAVARGLTIEPATAAALSELAPRVADLSGERRLDETLRILAVGRGAGLAALHGWGVLAAVAPALTPHAASELARRGAALDALPAAAPAAALLTAATLGLPAGPREAALRALHAPASLARDVRALHAAVAAEPDVALVLRGVDPALRAAALPALCGADAARRLEAELELLHLPGLDGHAVLATGVPPGPAIAAVLRFARGWLLDSGRRDPAAVRDAIAAGVATVVKRSPGDGR